MEFGCPQLGTAELCKGRITDCKCDEFEECVTGNKKCVDECNCFSGYLECIEGKWITRPLSSIKHQ